MKYTLLLLLLSAPCWAGPKYNYKDAKMNDEMDSIYHNIRNPIINYATISSATIDSLVVTRCVGCLSTSASIPGNLSVGTITFTSTGTLMIQGNYTLLYSSGTTLVMAGAYGFRANPTSILNQNTGFGYGVLTALTTAEDETAIGSSVLGNVTWSTDDTGVGTNALVSYVTGPGYNTAIGSHALDIITDSGFNTCVGTSCMGNAPRTTASTCVGVNCLYPMAGASFGNVGVGFDVGATGTNMSSTTLVGYYAGVNLGFGTGGHNNLNTCLGFQSCYDLRTATGVVMVGALDPGFVGTSMSNAIAIGWNAYPQGSNTAQIGGTNGSGKEVMVHFTSGTADSQMLSPAFLSKTANPSTTGILRLANADVIGWRNPGNTGNASLSLTASDQFSMDRALSIAPTSGQLFLGGSGGANYIAITAPTPAATRTYTIPDLGANGTFAFLSQLYGYNMTVFTATGTFTTSANSTTSTIYKYTIVGPGGGGGGSNGASAAAGGGGSGELATGTFTGVAANTAIGVAVSTAGTAGNTAGTNGSPGTGVSGIGTPVSIFSFPGLGGIGSTAGSASGGAGGTGGTGTAKIRIAGARGFNGNSTATLDGGNGASTQWGEGATGPRSGNGAIGAATGYGSGGAGGSFNATAGSNGTGGLVIIEQMTP